MSSQQKLQLIEPVSPPKLVHNSPVSSETPKSQVLSLFMPVDDEEEEDTPEKQQENDAFIRENFNVIEPLPSNFDNKSPNSLSLKELKQLSKGEYASTIQTNAVKKIVFPNGFILELKNKSDKIK
jgi:hypothetical protein